MNDIIGRRVLMFDSSLANVTVVADTTSATANAYGVRPGGLIAFRGDSTLFVDPASLSMLLIDPNGKIARVMSAPRAQDVGFLVGGPFGNPTALRTWLDDSPARGTALFVVLVAALLAIEEFIAARRIR